MTLHFGIFTTETTW